MKWIKLFPWLLYVVNVKKRWKCLSKIKFNIQMQKQQNKLIDVEILILLNYTSNNIELLFKKPYVPTSFYDFQKKVPGPKWTK